MFLRAVATFLRRSFGFAFGGERKWDAHSAPTSGIASEMAPQDNPLSEIADQN
jgi:hypothetical protein